MNQTLSALADEYFETYLEAHPSSATLLGDHRFNDRIESLSKDVEAGFGARYSSIIDRTRDLDPDQLDHPDRVTRAMLLSEAGRERDRIEAGHAEFRSDQLDGVQTGLLASVPLYRFPDGEAATTFVGRIRQIDKLLGSAADRFTEAASRGRTPARINIERSIVQVDGYLALPLERDPFLGLPAPGEWNGEAKWRDQLTEAVRTVVRPAFQEYRRVLADELLPQARPDEKPGLAWLDEGEDLYTMYAEAYTTTSLTSEEIHAVGRKAIEEQLPPEYSKLGKRAFGIDDPETLFEHLRTDDSLRFSSGQEMIDVARESLARAAAEMGDWFGTTPRAPCVIDTVPEELASGAPRAYYYPPSDDGSRPGTHFVNMRDADQQNRYDAEAVAFHESIPGHHFQVALSVELEGVPLFQRHARPIAFIEGWGLYSERLSDEMGLYSSDLDRIGMLSNDSWRACRLVVDTGIHAMGWSRQQAVDYIVQNSAVAQADAIVEVDRYIGVPGQALAYKIGELEILRLRQMAEERLGSLFDIKAFHDAVLTQGPLTLGLLAEEVERWVESHSDAGG